MSFNGSTRNLLKAALAKRQILSKSTKAIRLINGIGDGIDGLILEQYDKHFVAQVFDDIWLKELGCLKGFLMENFEVDYLIVKDRTKSSSSNPQAIGFQVLIAKTESRCIVSENNLNFEVDLNDTLNTGLFLDMRANRFLVAKECLGKRVLNCFSYTCSFGVYARAHGAKEVVNVDVSQKILKKGEQNYHLNKITPTGGEFIKADAVIYLEKAVKKNNFFDVIILDPPSFSRAGGNVFSVEKNLPQLIESALKVLKDNGKIFVSTNFSGISQKDLERIFKKSSQGRNFRSIVTLGQGLDFVGSGKSKESHLAALWAQ